MRAALPALRVLADVKRARRDHADKAWLASEAEASDREAESRMGMLVRSILMAGIVFVMVAAGVLITDGQLGTEYVADVIAWARSE